MGISDACLPDLLVIMPTFSGNDRSQSEQREKSQCQVSSLNLSGSLGGRVLVD